MRWYSRGSTILLNHGATTLVGKVLKMKIVLIVIGTLAGLYTFAAIVQFIGAIQTSDPTLPYRTANIAASAAPICLGLVVCLACFGSAFRKRQP